LLIQIYFRSSRLRLFTSGIIFSEYGSSNPDIN
jgi:hypothetical protein